MQCPYLPRCEKSLFQFMCNLSFIHDIRAMYISDMKQMSQPSNLLIATNIFGLPANDNVLFFVFTGKKIHLKSIVYHCLSHLIDMSLRTLRIIIVAICYIMNTAFDVEWQ